MVAKYIEIANDIKHQIITGHFKNNLLLPKQEELATYYKISRMTLQKAINILKVEGILISKKGVGTLINPNLMNDMTFDSPVDQWQGATKDMKDKGILTSEIISFDICPPNEVEMSKLNLRDTEKVYNIIRLRKLNNEPHLLEYTIMPVNLILDITNDVLKKSIYNHIQNILNLKIGSAIRRIHADVPDAYDKSYLNATDKDAILEVSQVVYLDDGQPFEYSQVRHLHDKGDFIYINHIN